MVWAIWPLSIWSGISRKSFNLKLLHIFTFNSQLRFHFLLAFVLFHYPPLITDTNRTSRDRFLRSVSGTRTNVLKTISWAGWNEDLLNVKYLVYQCTCVWRCSLDLHDMQREVIWRKSLYFHNFFDKVIHKISLLLEDGAGKLNLAVTISGITGESEIFIFI